MHTKEWNKITNNVLAEFSKRKRLNFAVRALTGNLLAMVCWALFGQLDTAFDKTWTMLFMAMHAIACLYATYHLTTKSKAEVRADRQRDQAQ